MKIIGDPAMLSAAGSYNQESGGTKELKALSDGVYLRNERNSRPS